MIRSHRLAHTELYRVFSFALSFFGHRLVLVVGWPFWFHFSELWGTTRHQKKKEKNRPSRAPGAFIQLRAADFEKRTRKRAWFQSRRPSKKKKTTQKLGSKKKEEKEEEEDGPSRNRRGVQRRPRGRHTRPHRKGATRKNVSIILYNVLFFMSGAYSNRFYRWFRPSFLLLVLFFFYFGRFRYIVATAQCRMRAPFFFCSFVRVPSFTEFYRVLPSVTECYGFIPSFIELYRVLSNLTEFYRVLPSFFLFGPVSPRGRRRFIVL